MTKQWTKMIYALACMGGIVAATACGSSSSSTDGGTDTDSGTNTMDAAQSCGTGSTSCNNVCVPLARDPENCGMCGKACATGEVCSQGMCASSCTNGTAHCGNECVDTKSDPRNCGMCGTACKANEVCSMGACALACVMGATKCGQSCVDTKTDRTNCGMCGTLCGGGEICNNGKCEISCQMSQTKCTGSDGGADYCANTQVDNTNCGSCGNTCASLEVCVNGQCSSSCIQGQTKCVVGNNTYCANTQTDNANCGMCGQQCGAQEVCIAGQCSSACIQGQTKCVVNNQTFCANLQSDKNNCGACGKVCAIGCNAGQCTLGLLASYTASQTFTDQLPTTTMTMTFDGTNYWSSSGGSNSGNRLARYSGAGALLNLYASGIDHRSVNTVNGKSATVYSRAYASNIVQTQSSPGVFVNAITLAGGTLDAQSSITWNTAGNELVAINNGTLQRWNSTGVYIGTLALKGFAGNENQYPQNRGVAIANGYYLTYYNQILSIWDNGGNRIATVTLTGAGTSFDSYFSLSYANNMVFVVDQAGGAWRGYNIGF